MLVRREALQSAGFMDERFFLFCDETDLCLRIKQAGWEVHHPADLTILHYAGKAGWNPKLEAQGAYAPNRSTSRSTSRPLTVSPLLRPSPLATACALLHGRRNVSEENLHGRPSALFSVVDRLPSGSRRASRFVLNSAGVRKVELKSVPVSTLARVAVEEGEGDEVFWFLKAERHAVADADLGVG